MKTYLDALRDIRENGVDSDDRTGVGTRRLFSVFMRYDLSKGFPMVTTKKMAFWTFAAELLWFIEGSTDERRLAELTFEKSRNDIVQKRTIWTDNADNQGVALGYENNDDYKGLGPIYGFQWRNWSGYNQDMKFLVIDQLANLIDGIKKDPNGRRHVLSAWNAVDIPDMALPPCHTIVIFNVIAGKLNCHLTQRSGDFFLGVPANIMSYAMLTHMIAKECGLEVGEFAHTVVDAHIYKNHFDAVDEQLKREPLPLPTLEISDEFFIAGYGDNPEHYELDNRRLFKLNGYQSHEKISAPMAI